MKEKSKVVELSGYKFSLRRLPADVGSYIFMRMMGVSMRNAAAAAENQPVATAAAEQQPEPTKATGAEKVRALSFIVFSGGMNFDDFKFIQRACLGVVSSIEHREGQDFPIPIMSDSGVATPQGEDILCDVGLVMRLVSEVLIFCFADFFDESSPGS